MQLERAEVLGTEARDSAEARAAAASADASLLRSALEGIHSEVEKMGREAAEERQSGRVGVQEVGQVSDEIARTVSAALERTEQRLAAEAAQRPPQAPRAAAGASEALERLEASLRVEVTSGMRVLGADLRCELLGEVTRRMEAPRAGAEESRLERASQDLATRVSRLEAAELNLRLSGLEAEMKCVLLASGGLLRGERRGNSEVDASRSVVSRSGLGTPGREVQPLGSPASGWLDADARLTSASVAVLGSLQGQPGRVPARDPQEARPEGLATAMATATLGTGRIMLEPSRVTQGSFMHMGRADAPVANVPDSQERLIHGTLEKLVSALQRTLGDGQQPGLVVRAPSVIVPQAASGVTTPAYAGSYVRSMSVQVPSGRSDAAWGRSGTLRSSSPPAAWRRVASPMSRRREGPASAAQTPRAELVLSVGAPRASTAWRPMSSMPILVPSGSFHAAATVPVVVQPTWTPSGSSHLRLA